jgi:FkbM family methyltransferase
MIDGQAESLLEAFYSAWLSPGDRAVDVGAHTGRHTLPLAAVVGPQGCVFAYEPLPFAADALGRNLAERSPSPPIVLERAAVGAEPGEAELVVALDRPEESGLRERARYSGETRLTRIKVAVTTLDRSVPPGSSVRFVKIDVEGAEWAVLKGGEDLIRRDQPAIGFEFGARVSASYGTTPEDLFDWLADRNYAVFDLRGHRHTRESFAERCDMEMLWDYVAVPQGDAADRAMRVLQDNYRSRARTEDEDSGSDEDYVRRCYRELLGRDPDPGGFDYYVERLKTHGWTRDEVAMALRGSDEHRRHQERSRGAIPPGTADR